MKNDSPAKLPDLDKETAKAETDKKKKDEEQEAKKEEPKQPDLSSLPVLKRSSTKTFAGFRRRSFGQSSGEKSRFDEAVYGRHAGRDYERRQIRPEKIRLFKNRRRSGND
jgi:hypothetical protein